MNLSRGNLAGVEYLVDGDRLYATILVEGNMRAVAQWYSEKDGATARHTGWKLTKITLEHSEETAMREQRWTTMWEDVTRNAFASTGAERWVYYILVNRAEAWLKAFVAQKL